MSKELPFAISLARTAGRRALRGLSKAKIVAAKDGLRSYCTDYDLKLEKIILDAIRSRYPAHGFISEEAGSFKSEREFVWIIDPLDGTRFFERGINYFTISIALYRQGQPFIGVVYNPGNGELYFAERGKGAFCGHKKLRVSGVNRLSQAVIGFCSGGLSQTSPAEKKIINRRLQKIISHCYRFFNIGSGTLSPCYLARGYFDAYFDLSGREHIWDPAGGIVVALEAGAKVTNITGGSPGLDARHLVLTNGLIHKNFLDLLN